LIKINFDWATRPAEGGHTKNHPGHKEKEEIAPYYEKESPLFERELHTINCLRQLQFCAFLLKGENLYLRLWM